MLFRSCLFIYLIFWLRRVLVAAHRIFLEACGLFVVELRLLSSCGVRAPGCVGSVVCGTQALSLRRASSIVVACGLNCPGACGILVPQPGIKPESLALEGGSSTTGPPGKSPPPPPHPRFSVYLLIHMKETFLN